MVYSNNICCLYIIIIMFDGAITCKKLYLLMCVATAQEVDGESFLLLKEDDLCSDWLQNLSNY